jgi:hypothetical protein
MTSAARNHSCRSCAGVAPPTCLARVLSSHAVLEVSHSRDATLSVARQEPPVGALPGTPALLQYEANAAMWRALDTHGAPPMFAPSEAEPVRLKPLASAEQPVDRARYRQLHQVTAGSSFLPFAATLQALVEFAVDAVDARRKAEKFLTGAPPPAPAAPPPAPSAAAAAAAPPPRPAAALEADSDSEEGSSVPEPHGVGARAAGSSARRHLETASGPRTQTTVRSSDSVAVAAAARAPAKSGVSGPGSPVGRTQAGPPAVNGVAGVKRRRGPQAASEECQ